MVIPKATAVFDVDDSRLSGALARINGRMLRRAGGAYKVTACNPNEGAAAIMWWSLVWIPPQCGGRGGGEMSGQACETTTAE